MSLSLYRQLKVIGRGSTSIAILVIEKSTLHQYIIKQIPVSAIQSNVLKEIEVLSILKHPNIIKYYSSFKEDNTLNICIEYADGGDLSVFINRIYNNNENNLLSEDAILDIFTQILLALDYCHNKNIIHRDLKPNNIFLTRKGIVKLGDFGISKSLLTAESIRGPITDISPEQLNDNKQTKESDLWGLGCILYELCTGLPPFDGSTIIGLFQKVLSGNYSPVNTRFSKELIALIAALLDTNPINRPSTDKIMRSSLLFDRVVKIQISDSDYGNVLKPSEKFDFYSMINNNSNTTNSNIANEANSNDKANDEFLHYWNLKDDKIKLGYNETEAPLISNSEFNNPKIINIVSEISGSNLPVKSSEENEYSFPICNIKSKPLSQTPLSKEPMPLKADLCNKSLTSWLNEVESMADKIQTELSDKSPARLFVHNSVRVPQTEPKSRRDLSSNDFNTPEYKNKPNRIDYTPEVKQLSTPSAHLKPTQKNHKTPITLFVKVKPAIHHPDISTPSKVSSKSSIEESRAKTEFKKAREQLRIQNVIDMKEREKNFLSGLKKVGSKLPPRDNLKGIALQTHIADKIEDPENEVNFTSTNSNSVAFITTIIPSPIVESPILLRKNLNNALRSPKQARTPFSLRQFKQNQKRLLENQPSDFGVELFVKSDDLIVESKLDISNPINTTAIPPPSPSPASYKDIIPSSPNILITTPNNNASFLSDLDLNNLIKFPVDADLQQKIDISKETCENYLGPEFFLRVYRNLRDLSDAEDHGKLDERKIVVTIRPYLPKILFPYIRFVCLLVYLENEYFHNL